MIHDQLAHWTKVLTYVIMLVAFETSVIYFKMF